MAPSVELTAHRQVQSATGKFSGLAQATHRTGEKTKAQRGALTYPRSHSQRAQDEDSNPYHGSVSADSPGAPEKLQEANGGVSAGHREEGPGWTLGEEWPKGAGPQRLQLSPKACPAVVMAAPRRPHVGSNPGPVPGSSEALFHRCGQFLLLVCFL